MLNEIKEILRTKDDTFTFYQYPKYFVYDAAIQLIDEFGDDNYMGLRESWKLIKEKDMTRKYVAEIGCNIGATSHELLNEFGLALYSFDPSPKAVQVCWEVRKYHMMLQWEIICAKFEHTEGFYDTIIWEDPHTATDEEWQVILDQIYRRCKTVYFLECDNIYHLIKDKDLEQLSENSWRLVQ